MRSKAEPNGVAGWMQTDLPALPATFMFDELRDLSAWPAAIDDMIDMKCSCSRSSNTANNSNNKTSRLAQPGQYYVSHYNTNGKIWAINTQICSVEVDPHSGRRTMITVCNLPDFIKTTTFVVEALTEDSTDPSNSSKSGCRWTLSYAMLPKSLYGYYLFWLRRNFVRQWLLDMHVHDFECLKKSLEERYYGQQQRQRVAPSSRSRLSTATTCITTNTPPIRLGIVQMAS